MQRAPHWPALSTNILKVNFTTPLIGGKPVSPRGLRKACARSRCPACAESACRLSAAGASRGPEPEEPAAEAGVEDAHHLEGLLVVLDCSAGSGSPDVHVDLSRTLPGRCRAQQRTAAGRTAGRTAGRRWLSRSLDRSRSTRGALERRSRPRGRASSHWQPAQPVRAGSQIYGRTLQGAAADSSRADCRAAEARVEHWSCSRPRGLGRHGSPKQRAGLP